MRRSGIDRPSMKMPSENKAESNGLEKDEKKSATDVITTTFMSSSQSALAVADSTSAP